MTLVSDGAEKTEGKTSAAQPLDGRNDPKRRDGAPVGH